MRKPRFLAKALLVTGCLLALGGCDPVEPVQHAEDAIPDSLFEWGMLYRQGDRLHWAEASAVYDLTTPLFTDYAHKLRSVYVPQGASVTRDESGRFQYPVGTVFSKTFYYPRGESAGEVRKTEFNSDDIREGIDLRKHRLLETRLLVHYESGWQAISYVWSDDQREARRKITGAVLPLTLVEAEGSKQNFHYVVPDANQCRGCHATAFNTRQSMPIGPARPDFINRDSPLGSGNQLVDWQQRGWLQLAHDDLPQAPDWQDSSASLADRARAYLDINCAHCHSATGAADTSGLWLERHVAADQRLGICKPPIAAGQGTGGNQWGIDPGEPENSILIYRMASQDPGAMMPELGRSLVHREGLALVSEWIANLDAQCGETGSGILSR